jgi:hypothetical protein
MWYVKSKEADSDNYKFKSVQQFKSSQFPGLTASEQLEWNFLTSEQCHFGQGLVIKEADMNQTVIKASQSLK